MNSNSSNKPGCQAQNSPSFSAQAPPLSLLDKPTEISSNRVTDQRVRGSHLPYRKETRPLYRNDLWKAFNDLGMIDDFMDLMDCGVKGLPFKCQQVRQGVQMPNDGEMPIVKHCGKRVGCFDCAETYGKKIYKRYYPVIYDLLNSSKGQKDQLMLLTLTTINTGTIPPKFEIFKHNCNISKIKIKTI